MACNHNSRGWRRPADVVNFGLVDGIIDGCRCVDCGLILCTEIINGDLRSPNGKRPFGREFCDRVATLTYDWTTTKGVPHVGYVCGIHRRRHRQNNPRPFDNVAPVKEGVSA